MKMGRFFFQAEDGIQYIGVTGVQTCALPISLGTRSTALFDARGLVLATADMLGNRTTHFYDAAGAPLAQQDPREIGRASWKGKSVDLGGRRIINKKYFLFGSIHYRHFIPFFS